MSYKVLKFFCQQLFRYYFISFDSDFFSSPPEQLGKLDLVKWREDKRGCEGIRPGLLA